MSSLLGLFLLMSIASYKTGSYYSYVAIPGEPAQSYINYAYICDAYYVYV